MTKHYIISSSLFKTKTAAERQINEWKEEGMLDEECKIYEITKKTKVYEPALKLEEVK